MFKKQQAVQYIDLKSKSGQQRKFTKVKFLGSGGFARCYQVYEETNQIKQHYAFKIIKKSTLYQSQQLIERLRVQIRLHKKFSQLNETSSQHIVRFIQSFETQDYIYLLLQLCVNQTLNELIKRRKFLTEQQTRFYILQLAFGLKEIHSKNIIHRDIKLCNLFLSHGLKIKIGDFGLANQIKQGRKRYTICGTANYIAPQMISKDQNVSSIGHGYEVDIWALGVVCYTIFYGRYPFQAQQQQSIYNKVLACKYSFSPYTMKEIKQLNINGLNHYPSDELKSFIKMIFEIDPSKRMTLDQVFNHPFLTKTTVPIQLPEIALKCSLKRENIEKMFKIKNTTQNSLNQNKKQWDQKDYQPIKQQCKLLQSQISTKLKNQVGSQNEKQCCELKNSSICIQNNGYCQNSLGNYNKIQQKDKKQKELILYPHSKCEDIFHTKGNIYFKYLRKRNFSTQTLNYLHPKQLDSLSKKSQIYHQNLLLQIIFSNPKNQLNKSLEQCYVNGMMIKVYNFKQDHNMNEMITGLQSLKNAQNQYTIIIHPRLNYLTKVFDRLKSKIDQRIPLEEVPGHPKNTLHKQIQGFEKKCDQQKRGSLQSQRVIIKIPLKRQACSFQNNLFQMNPKNFSNKYQEEMNIVKLVYVQLNRKFENKEKKMENNKTFQNNLNLNNKDRQNELKINTQTSDEVYKYQQSIKQCLPHLNQSIAS